MHWRDKSLVAALGIWLHYPNKDNYLRILSLLPLPTLISLNGLLCTMEPGLTWNLQPWWVRMSWSDHAWATSYVHLSLVLSLPPFLWTYVVALFLLWPFLLLPPAQSPDGSQIFFTVCCWQLWLPHADAAEPGQRGHCLSWGCAQLLPCPLLWDRFTLAALWHSDPRIKCNPFTFVLGWSSLASQISDLGDGGKTIRREKNAKKLSFAIIFKCLNFNYIWL